MLLLVLVNALDHPLSLVNTIVKILLWLVFNNKILINWFHTTREAFYNYPCAYTTTTAPVVSNNCSYGSAGIFGTHDGTLTGVNVKEITNNGQHWNEPGVVICIGY
ncbi:MAG: hypothetical protein IJ272_04485 [Clostridia bacterium]|nr:hypothetical protein [Clostridia bacterium]